MTNKLGQFLTDYELSDDSGLVVRGLNVAEYIDLSQRDFFTKAQVKPSLFVEIAQACVVDWYGVIDENGDEIKYSKELLGVLEHEELILVGKFVVEQATIVDKELEDKVRGYVRFTSHVSKDKNKYVRESFDCTNCIKKGYWEGRATLCSKYTAEDVARIRGTDEVETQTNNTTNIEKAKDKLRSNKRRRRPKKTENKSNILFLNNFKFPECPISWIDDWIFIAGGVLYHSADSDIPFFAGGLAEQPYKLYKISRVIAGESNTIDKEEYEERNK